jgi:hypothetical protein
MQVRLCWIMLVSDHRGCARRNPAHALSPRSHAQGGEMPSASSSDTSDFVAPFMVFAGEFDQRASAVLYARLLDDMVRWTLVFCPWKFLPGRIVGRTSLCASRIRRGRDCSTSVRPHIQRILASAERCECCLCVCGVQRCEKKRRVVSSPRPMLTDRCQIRRVSCACGVRKDRRQ